MNVAAKNLAPVKSLATFGTNVTFFSRMNDEMEIQLFFSLESFETDCTHVRTFWIMRLFVPREVVLALQPCATYIAHESSFQCVTWERYLKIKFVK